MAINQRSELDAAIRQAAFDHIRTLQSRDLVLSHQEIERGFQFGSQRVPFVNPQRGIFKPSQMPFLLSIRTVSPRKGGRVFHQIQNLALRRKPSERRLRALRLGIPPVPSVFQPLSAWTLQVPPSKR